MTAVTVLETNIVHAGDVIYWLDGTTAPETARMARLSRPLMVAWTACPKDLHVLHGPGKTAIWRRPMAAMIAGQAAEADKRFTAGPLFALSGTVRDPDGRYNPRAFAIAAGQAAGHLLALYPSPLGTRMGKAGGLIGTLRWDATGLPVPWARLTLTVATGLGAPLVFRAQADGHGDFRLSMKALPPLPESIAYYEAELGAEASPEAAADTPVDPDAQAAMTLGASNGPELFSTRIAFRVVPGDILLIRSLDRNYLAVKPSSP